MGWGSAGYRIFDPVAKALQEAGAQDEVRTRVLSGLIGELREEDWDTEYDSLEAFKDDPAVVAAFAEHDLTLAGDDDDS
jgi:hypothetical protein